MAKTYTLPFHHISKKDINVVGGKGANLGEMMKAGFPVPEGFCIPVNAYKNHLYHSNIFSFIEESLKQIQWDDHAQIEQISAKIQSVILEQDLSEEIKQDIIDAYRELANNEEIPVAVRSSATAEDLPEASFAGQQETYLYIKGEAAVLDHVKKCWASLWTTRAMVYREKNNFRHQDVYLAVVVQKMVASEVSGVAFSNNPMTNNEKEILINASFGLGEVVVAGTVTPDVFILNKKDGSLHSKQMGAKAKQLVANSEGQVVMTDTPVKQQEIFSLNESQLLRLYALAIKVENHYQYPQDIEWAIADGNLYLLQTRPITTIEKSVLPEIDIDFDKLNKFQKWMIDDLIEHYPQAPLPLDYSVVKMSYQSVLDCAGYLGVKMARAEEIMQFSTDGKIHLQVTNIRFSHRLLLMPYRLYKASKISTKEWQGLKQNVDELVNDLEVLPLSEQSNRTLLQHWNNIFSHAKLVSDLRFFYIAVASLLPMSILSSFVKKRNKRYRNDPITSIDLLTNGLDYQTVIIDRELHRLALFAREDKELKKLISHNENKTISQLKAKLMRTTKGKEFQLKLQSFLDTYGYRTEKMYQPFTSKAWAENSSEFPHILQAVIQDPFLSVRLEKEQQRKNDFEKQIAVLEKEIKKPFRRLFKWSLSRLREFYILREETVFSLEKLFTVGRKFTSEFGQRLTHIGILDKAEDIIYLKKEEVEEFLLTGLTNKAFLPIIAERKENSLVNQQMWKHYLLSLAKQKSNEDSLQGIIGSPGLAQGPVRIVLSVEDFNKVEKGDVLVCPYTDPTWTPLFGIISAVIADTGGQLSHAAIVAREYGIPAILGTKIGTSMFKEGEQVIVDGTTGTVTYSK